MSSLTTTEYFDETTTLSPTIIEPTTNQTPLTTLATTLFDIVGNAPKTAIPKTTTTTTTTASEMMLSPTTNLFQREHLEHNKITFEIPNHHDLEHIDSMHKFNALLKRIGNVVTTVDASQFTHSNHEHQLQSEEMQQQQLLTNAEISKSVVLDLADLNGNSDAGFGFNFDFERFFAGADMHSIINYLWIGVVTSLIILSVIFIVFSCYFYRKFREWKKCNKDIRTHLNENSLNNNFSNTNEIFYAHGGTTTAATYFGQMPERGGQGAAYYQIQSPPCYTIATGLPSYDEALLHHHHHHNHQNAHQHQNNDIHRQQQQQQHQNYFNYAFKYMYATPAAIHQREQQHMDAVENVNVDASNIADGHFIGNWKKTTTATTTSTSIDDVEDKMLQYCCSTTTNNVDRKNSKITSNKKQRQQRIKVSTLPPPAYDVTATNTNIALLSGNDMESTPMLVDDDENKDNAINICIPDEIFLLHKEINIDEKQQQNTPEGNNAASSEPTTIFSHTNNDNDIDDSLNDIIVVVA